MSKFPKVHYNSPLILTFSLMCIGIYALNAATRTAPGTGLLDPLCTLRGNFNYNSVSDYFGAILYIFNHGSTDHLLGNLGFILLLGPILEEKYGVVPLLKMILITTLITAMLNIVLFSTGIIGASGIVFMFIVLISFANVKDRSIPFTFILIFLLFVGKEVYNSFSTDNVSQFGHILGGICGSLFGFSNVYQWNKKKDKTSETPTDTIS